MLTIYNLDYFQIISESIILFENDNKIIQIL